jgi:hypothetical protein
MSEMALTADHLVVLGRGRLVADVSPAELTARADGRVLVRPGRRPPPGRTHPVHASLEDAYLAMTHSDVEFSVRAVA